ncbi:MAG: DUF2118 domain-containing protein, partial [Erythrobacter sp.]|nr:DUF2118 domain-containing protein [Erythrobacter sp.]
YQSSRQAAFDAERAAWEASGEFDRVSQLTEEAEVAGEPEVIDLPEGAQLVEAPFGGSVWKLLVKEGDQVEAGETVAVIEAMKMESPLESPASGTVEALYIQERQAIEPGAPMFALKVAS